MTPEDFLKQDFNKMEFHLNHGMLEIIKLRLEIENKWYSLSIMKNQLRIKEYLQNGNIDEEKIAELMKNKLIGLDSEIHREMADQLALITSKAN